MKQKVLDKVKEVINGKFEKGIFPAICLIEDCGFKSEAAGVKLLDELVSDGILIKGPTASKRDYYDIMDNSHKYTKK